MSNREKSTLVFGLGNPLLSDDTAGILAVRLAEETLPEFAHQVDYAVNFSGSFDLLHEIAGYHNVLVVDSIQTGRADPGFCHACTVNDLQAVKQASPVNWHNLNLPTVLEAGRECGFSLPENIILLGIEGENFTDFSEEPTPLVKNALPTVVSMIKTQLRFWQLSR